MLIVIVVIGISLQFVEKGDDGANTDVRVEVKGIKTGGDNQGTSKLDLNKATLSQLIKLPGIGPSKAKAIMDYREKIGRFHSLEQLMEVSGIGEKTFEKLKDYLFVEFEEKNVGFEQQNRVVSYSESNRDFPININTADVDLLQKLPGIGKVKARAIVEYREKNGGFRTKDEIKEVKGIGEKTFEKLKDLIVVY